MSEFILPGTVTAESEFVAGSGACGPTALSAAIRWSKQSSTTPDARSVMNQMHAWGLCDSIGVTNTPEIRTAIEKYGLKQANRASGEDILGFATHFFSAAQEGAVILEIANGQALKDSITGAGEDASNLHYHFICLVGYNSGGVSPRDGGKTLPAGFWAADGDSNVQNPIVNGARVHRGLNTDLQFYSVSDLAAAQPYDAVAVLPEVTAGSVPVGISLTNPSVAYWYEASGTSWALKSNPSLVIEAGPILSFYETFGGNELFGLTYLGLPVANQEAVAGKAGVVMQRFERGIVVSDPNHSFDGPPSAGPVYLAHINDVALSEYAKPLIDAAVAAQAKTDAAQLATVQSQLAAVNSKLSTDDAALSAAQQADASDEQKLADANSQIQQLDALVQQLQAKVDALQATPLESDADKAAVQALINLDAAIIAAKKASGLV